MSTIRLSADQCTATIPPVKAVRVRFVASNLKSAMRCYKCLFYEHSKQCRQMPCCNNERRDGRNGYWVEKKGGEG
jgi:hypothetical protein